MAPWMILWRTRVNIDTIVCLRVKIKIPKLLYGTSFECDSHQGQKVFLKVAAESSPTILQPEAWPFVHINSIKIIYPFRNSGYSTALIFALGE